MSLSSISFIGIYFPLLLLAYYNPFFRSKNFKKVILLLASFGLYAVAEPIYIFLLMFSVLFNYIMVQIEMQRKKHIFGNLAIVMDVLVLIFFKYVNQVMAMCFLSDGKVVSIAFPIGLSYFTFREISYVVDSRKMKKSVKANIIDVGLFICNFMSITAGPLGFYEQEIAQIKGEIRIDHSGMERFAVGLIKKIVIADSLKNLADCCFAQNQLSVFMAWIGAIAYTLQIYYDFSGYSDMAIGIGKVLGFQLEENFNMPYIATSVSDFWKRWHMSLTKWFTRYIYIPLGGSRVKSSARHIFNLWVVWLCTGIWHGSNWTFILWGMIYFVLQALEKYTSISEKINHLHLGHLYTLFVVNAAWVIFRSKDITSAFQYLGTMIGIRANGFMTYADIETVKYYLLPLLAGILFASSVPCKIKELTEKHRMVQATVRTLEVMLFIISIVLVMGRGYTASLYAGF